MSSRHVRVADAVVALLNGAPGGTFDMAFTARREWLPKAALVRDLATLRVEVMPLPVEATIESRDQDTREEVSIGIVFRKKIASDPDSERDEADAVDAVVEKVRDYIVKNDIDVFGGIAPTAVELTPVYDGDRLEQDGVFSSAISVTYTNNS